MRNFKIICSLFVVAILFASCAEVAMEPDAGASASPETRAASNKTPKVVTYIEVNDINPLNAVRYTMNNTQFIDIVNIFAANIWENTGIPGEPSLWLNDNVTKILVPNTGSTTTGHYKYVQPLRQAGIKVLLTILGDHKGVGVSNLVNDNPRKFAKILADAVEEYQLDGIDFDDEWSKVGVVSNPEFPSSADANSFSNLVLALRAEFNTRFPGAGKLITVFHIGAADGLTQDAIDAIDYGYYEYFGTNNYVTPPSGWVNAKWSAQAINLNSSYNSLYLGQIKTQSGKSKTNGMGAIMTYDLRVSPSPLPIFQKISEGAYSNATVSQSSTSYSKDWVPGNGTELTY